MNPFTYLCGSMGIAASIDKKNISDLSFINKLYYEKYNTALDPNWLGRFIGFTEGDGYLGVNDNVPVFVLTQK